MSDPRNYDPIPRCQYYRSGVQCRFSPRHPGDHEFIDAAFELRTENERLREQLAAANAEIEAADQRMFAILEGTFAIGDGTAQREIERLRGKLMVATNASETRVRIVEQQLAAMTKARDEACALANKLRLAKPHVMDHDAHIELIDRITELEKVGQ